MSLKAVIYRILEKLLKSLTGLKEEQIKGVLTINKEVEIKVDGNDYTLSGALGTRTFPLGKEIDEKLPDGHVLKVSIFLIKSACCILILDSNRAQHPLLETSLPSSQRVKTEERAKGSTRLPEVGSHL